jgi:glycosyltransferase involved in cell wall biosynthesis
VQAIKYVAFCDRTGYGIAARSYREMLACSGAPLLWDPLLPKPRRLPWFGRTLDRSGLGFETKPAVHAGSASSKTGNVSSNAGGASSYDRLLLHAVPEYYSTLQAAAHRETHAKFLSVGMTVWETDRLPRHWPPILNALDGVIVPTEWNRRVFLESGVRVPVSVVPHASQFAGMPAEAAALERLRARLPNLQGKYIFYSVATWLERKGNLCLLRAFTRAFAGRSDVVLILKTTEHDLEDCSRDWRNGFRRQGKLIRPWLRAQGFLSQSPRILLLDEDLEDAEMQALHCLGDSYVSLTRGEGWGLGAFEAAFFGKPVITTGFGGSLAFLPADKSLLVEYGLTPVRTSIPDRSYTADQRWAEPNEDHAIACLHWVFEHQQAAREQGAALRRHVGENFSFQQAALALERALMQGGGAIQ